MFCPACGTDVPPRSKFCFKCGTKLSAPIPSEPAGGPTPRRTQDPTGTWPSIGILFDIDAIRGDNDDAAFFYGREVRRIFMTHFDPAAVGRAILWHGETQATLDGDERFWCIAITVADPTRLDLVRAAFLRIEARGLPPGAQRFREHPVDVTFRGAQPVPLRREPLMQWLLVDETGTLILAQPTAEDAYLCRKFRKKFRLPDGLQSQLERIQNGTAAPETVAPKGTDEEACIIEAIDLEIPGVPANLAKYVDYFQKSGPKWGLQFAAGRLEEIIGWPREKLTGRPDRKELEDSLALLGRMFFSIEVYEGAEASFSKLAECVGDGDPRSAEISSWRQRCLLAQGKRQRPLAE